MRLLVIYTGISQGAQQTLLACAAALQPTAIEKRLKKGQDSRAALLESFVDEVHIDITNNKITVYIDLQLLV